MIWIESARWITDMRLNNQAMIVYASRRCQAAIRSDGSIGSASHILGPQRLQINGQSNPSKEDDFEHVRTSCSVDQQY